MRRIGFFDNGHLQITIETMPILSTTLFFTVEGGNNKVTFFRSLRWFRERIAEFTMAHERYLATFEARQEMRLTPRSEKSCKKH